MLNKWRMNFSLKLMSLLIAIVLWFIVLGSRNIVVTKEVPLEVITPQGLVVGNELPDKVSFQLSGPNAILRAVLNRSEMPLQINLSNSRTGTSIYRFYQDHIQIPLGVKVLSIIPASLSIRLEKVKEEEVTLRLTTVGQLSPGYQIQRLELLQNKVRLRGPESKLAQVNEISTAPLDLSKIKISGEQEVDIDLKKHPQLKLVGERPKVEFDISQSNATFKLKNISIKVYSALSYEIKPQTVSIYVRTSPELLSQLDEDKIHAWIDAKNKNAGNYELPVQVQIPPSFKLIKTVPARVQIRLGE